jgi:hypothetical protein
VKWLLALLIAVGAALSVARLAGADPAMLVRLSAYFGTVAVGALVGWVVWRPRKPGARDDAR